MGSIQFNPNGEIEYRAVQLNVRYFNWLLGQSGVAGSWAVTPSLGYARLSTSAENINRNHQDNNLIALGLAVDYELTRHWRLRLELMSLSKDAQSVTLQAERRFGEVPPSAVDATYGTFNQSVKQAVSSVSTSMPEASRDAAAADSARVAEQQASEQAQADPVIPSTDNRQNIAEVKPVARLTPDQCIDFSFYPNRIMFDDNSRTVSKAARRTLAELATELKRYSSVVVKIAAFTDTRGSAAVNQQLSTKRGNQVRDILQRNGIAKQRIQVMGFGEKQPMYSNDTEYGRAANRRVELSFSKPPGCID